MLAEDERALIRSAARDLLESEWSVEQAPTLATDTAAQRALWRLLGEQGWTSISVQCTELGLPVGLDLMLELGRASCNVPLHDAILANEVLEASASPLAKALLERLRSGEIAIGWLLEDSLAKGAGMAGSGAVPFVENAETIDVFLRPEPATGEIVVVPRDAVQILATPGLAVPALSELTIPTWASCDRFTSTFDLAQLVPLMRLLLATRATGAADRGLELLLEYAQERVQFGKKIGQFQAVQHKLADCFMAIQACRVSIVQAGVSTLERLPYLCAVAAANAGGGLRRAVLELHHGFGGIAFWEEHELPRHFRRVHADVTRLGGVIAARRDLANQLFQFGRIPELSLGKVADDFRHEVRSWLAEHWDHAYSDDELALPVNHRKARQSFSKELGRKGWLGLPWPREYGGQERSPMEQFAFEDEMVYQEAPGGFHLSSVNLIAPAIIRFGTPQQKAAFLPAIARGEVACALGFSEPGNGSDLAGLKTSARRHPDGGWVINGQKIYTSGAGFATHVWLAARTDPDQLRHSGISVFLLPMDATGVSIHPLRGLNDHRSNIVFYDDVRVSDDAMIGPENGGWKVIATALTHERVNMATIATRARSYFDRLLVEVSSGATGVISRDDAVVQDRIGALGSQLEAARLFGVELAHVLERGEDGGWRVPVAKVYSSELMESLAETAIDLLGPGATLKEGPGSARGQGRFEYAVRDALLYTIGGGTNEIQRTMIATQHLGMPR